MKQWQLSKENLGNLMIYLESLLKEGKHPVVTIKEKVSDNTQRTLDQNKYLWGHLYKSISNFTGYLPMEIHMLSGWMFLREQKTIGDKQIEYIRSTKDLSIAEMTEYIEKVIIYFTQLGWSNDGNNDSAFIS